MSRIGTKSHEQLGISTMIDLRLGDCLEVMATLPDASVDAVITDPPYGTTACKWDSVIPFEPMWAQLKRIIKPRGAIVLFGSQPFTSALVMSNPKWFKYSWVWEKSTGTGFLDVQRRPLKCHEDLLLFASGSTNYNPQKTPAPPRKTGWHSGSLSHYGSNVRRIGHNNGEAFPRSTLYFPMEQGTKHPTQKPVALLAYLVKTYTNEGDTVLDFTMGSGTTGVACVETGRNFIGIERDEGYYSIAQRRIETAATAPHQLELTSLAPAASTHQGEAGC